MKKKTYKLIPWVQITKYPGNRKGEMVPPGHTRIVKSVTYPDLSFIVEFMWLKDQVCVTYFGVVDLLLVIRSIRAFFTRVDTSPAFM